MLLADGMNLESAVVLFVLMLVAQIPLLITAVVAYIKSRTAIEEGAKTVADKVDHNTVLTSEGTAAAASNAATAATAAEDAKTVAAETRQVVIKRLNGGLEAALESLVRPIQQVTVNQLEMIKDHDVRIAALEVQMAAMKSSVDAVAKNVDSTRHEMRGHLETIARKLDIMSLTKIKE